MKENERLEVVKRIKKDIDKEKLIIENENKLEQLCNNPIIQQYLSLKEELEQLKINNGCFNNLLKSKIYLEFVRAFETRVKRKNIEPCQHEIYIYGGSII